MSKIKQPIVQKRTLLIVGEGADEKAFLSYLKEQLVPRGAGLMVTIKNAKGKGAKGVLDTLSDNPELQNMTRLRHYWIPIRIGQMHS
jgi:hypothetical protein